VMTMMMIVSASTATILAKRGCASLSRNQKINTATLSRTVGFDATISQSEL